jgi:hypothetical protein
VEATLERTETVTVVDDSLWDRANRAQLFAILDPIFGHEIVARCAANWDREHC